VRYLFGAHSEGFRLFDCSPSYADGLALQALMHLRRSCADIQVSLTVPCVGSGDGFPSAVLRQLDGLWGQVRIVGLQPRDKAALHSLPQTASRVKQLLGSTALSICNLPPHMAVLAAERIRAVFEGELFISLPSNSYTRSLNCQFLDAFRSVRAELIGYGLLLGGKNSIVGRRAYTYGQSVKAEEPSNQRGELSVDSAEDLATEALMGGGYRAILVGVRTQSQMLTWSAVLRRLSTANT